jgi:4'-phosphopantetheinyl transferase
VDVWLARDPLLRDASLLDRFARMLSPDEHERVARMQFPAGRHQQLVTRALTRQVLSHYRPEVAPADWRFERGEHGRPAIASSMPEAARTMNFNLAHTKGLVAMAVGCVPALGVDVERTDHAAPMAVAQRYFSPAEVTALGALPGGEQHQRFRRLWTLKEAYLKALGTGVAGGLGSMTFRFEPDGVNFECAADAAASRWVFREFELDGVYQLALAVLVPEGERPPSVALRDYLDA